MLLFDLKIICEDFCDCLIVVEMLYKSSFTNNNQYYNTSNIRYVACECTIVVGPVTGQCWCNYLSIEDTGYQDCFM